VANSSRIAAALIIGFVVFITMRGELPAYFAVMGIGKQTSTGTQSAGMGGGGSFGLPSLPSLGSLFGGSSSGPAYGTPGSTQGGG
jgi:hypothetical protein